MLLGYNFFALPVFWSVNVVVPKQNRKLIKIGFLRYLGSNNINSRYAKKWKKKENCVRIISASQKMRLNDLCLNLRTKWNPFFKTISRRRRYVRHRFLSILSDRSFSSTDQQSNLDSLVLVLLFSIEMILRMPNAKMRNNDLSCKRGKYASMTRGWGKKSYCVIFNGLRKRRKRSFWVKTLRKIYEARTKREDVITKERTHLES